MSVVSHTFKSTDIRLVQGPLVMATIRSVDHLPLDRHRVRSGREHTIAFPNNRLANRFANRCGSVIVDRGAWDHDLRSVESWCVVMRAARPGEPLGERHRP